MQAGFPVTERTLVDAEVLTARSWLRLHFTGDLAVARSDAEAALAIDRTNVLACLIEAALPLDRARGRPRNGGRAPDDWHAAAGRAHAARDV